MRACPLPAAPICQGTDICIRTSRPVHPLNMAPCSLFHLIVSAVRFAFSFKLLFVLGSEPKRRSDRWQKKNLGAASCQREARAYTQPGAPIVGGDEDATRLNSPFVFVEYSPSAARSDFVRPFRWMGSERAAGPRIVPIVVRPLAFNSGAADK
ncbi:hypothetical protein MRX96_003688 [Rhipicephalus microplus]